MGAGLDGIIFDDLEARLGIYVENICLVLSVYTMPYSNSALNSAVFALQ